MTSMAIKMLCGSVLVLTVATVSCGADFIELSQYYRMPKLAETDDYDRCMQGGPIGKVATFCMVRVVLKPDERSELWRLIEDFSKDWKRHHNHALLDRGVCIEECKKIVQKLPNATRQALRVEKFDIDFPYVFDVSVHKDTLKDRERYGALLDICINYRLNETYQLKGYTELEVCDKNDETLEIDLLDTIFLVVLATVIFLVTLSSWYDKTINYKQDVVHYKQDLSSSTKSFYVSFSILRNWYRLTSRSQDPLNKDVRFFQAIRYFTMNLVILGHAGMIAFILPTQNPAQTEMLYHNIGTMLLTGGVQITQTFFAMSGFLLAIHMVTYAEQRKRRPGILFLLKMIVYRYIRLTPVYGFVILLHATWLAKFQDGPMWKIGVESERVFCRRNWWTNLLYVNNYVHGDQPCVQQAWYLGCDFQLFILGGLLMIAVVNFRRIKTLILSVAAVASFLIPAYFIYHQELEGVFLVTPNAQRFVFWFDEFYQKSYIPLHVNLGNYLAGIITGLIYHHLKSNSIDPSQKTWFRILWTLVPLLGILTLLVHYIFYIYDFDKPSLWMAFYFPAMKYTWGVFSCIMIIGCIYRISPVLTRIFDHRVFEPLGRMTYTAYLSHVFVMRLLALSIRAPVHFSFIGVTTMILASVMFSYLVALFLCLTMELPVSALQKLIFGDMKGDVKQGTNSSQAMSSNESAKKPNTVSHDVESNNQHNSDT